ncbi:MAG: hypothetical protein Q7S61_05815 [bacterium]|nr:hypothetical protein [bacterium]
MGKIRTRTIGMEDVEEEQKKEQKKRSMEKKMDKKKKTDKKPEEVVVEETKKEAPKKIEKKEKKIVAHVRGKNYTKAKKTIDIKKMYSLQEAVEILKKIKYAGFDESVELHVNVNEEGLKGEVEFPYVTGKTLRIEVVSDKLLADLEEGKINFDILITHPSFMPKLAKFAKVLGPKGLMPNPKAGTISPNPEEVVKKFQKGTVKWKTELKAPIVHQMVAKISHENTAIVTNAIKLIESISLPHIKTAYMKTTMSPSVKIDLEKV